MAERGGLQLPPDSMLVAARAAMRALAAAYREDARRELGVYPARLEDDPVLNVSVVPPTSMPAQSPPALVGPLPPTEPNLTQAQTAGKEPIRPSSAPLLSAMIGEAVARLKKGNGHPPRTSRLFTPSGATLWSIKSGRDRR